MKLCPHEEKGLEARASSLLEGLAIGTSYLLMDLFVLWVELVSPRAHADSLGHVIDRCTIGEIWVVHLRYISLAPAPITMTRQAGDGQKGSTKATLQTKSRSPKYQEQSIFMHIVEIFQRPVTLVEDHQGL